MILDDQMHDASWSNALCLLIKCTTIPALLCSGRIIMFVFIKRQQASSSIIKRHQASSSIIKSHKASWSIMMSWNLKTLDYAWWCLMTLDDAWWCLMTLFYALNFLRFELALWTNGQKIINANSRVASRLKIVTNQQWLKRRELMLHIWNYLE